MSISPGFGVVLRDIPAVANSDEVAVPAAAPAASSIDALLEAIEAASEWDATTLQVPLAALPDPGETRSIAALRGALRVNTVELVLSLGVLNAVFPDRNPAFVDDLDAGLARAFASARALGISVAHTTVGTLEDRFGESGGPDWPTQLRVNGGMLARAAELAAAFGVTLVLKTHEEMSTAEVAELVSAVDSPALRVGFSPVNVLTRLENPVAAFERVRDLVHTVFVDDSALERTPDGLRRHMVEVGDGVIDWEAIRSSADAAPQPISMVIDLHRAEFDMPLFERGWLAREPHVTVPELASLFAASSATAPVLPTPDRRFATAREFVAAR